MSRALKLNDLEDISKLYEAEFNKPDLCDRILVFDVVASENPSNEHVFRIDESDGETSETEGNKELNDGKQIGIKNCEIPLKCAEGDHEIEDGVSDKNEDETVTNKNETSLHKDSNEIQEASKTEVIPQNETEVSNNDELNLNTRDDIKNQLESEITKDTHHDVNYTVNTTDQGENDNKGDEAISYPINKSQVIRQHKFYIHSSWLSVQSSYFRSLFSSGMKETSAKEVHVQTLESEEKAHLMLLEAMYKMDILDDASVDEVLEVLKLSYKYDVKFVFKKCKYCLQAEVVSLDICEKVMYFIKVANTFTDVEDLASTLQSFLAKEFSPLDKSWQRTSFKELCQHSLQYLLSSNELVAASENTIFHALLSWIEEQGIDNISETQGLLPLLSVVRFELITIDYLYNIVQKNFVAKKLAGFSDHYIRGISYHALTDTMKERLVNQPVKREACTEDIILYTWVIPKEELDTLLVTGKTLKSNIFWYCGYKIFLAINNNVKLQNSHGYDSGFKATLNLAICNLTEQSEVSFEWRPTSQSFTSNPKRKKYTFSHNKSISGVEIKYKMDIQPNAVTTIGAPTFGSCSPGLFSGGFNFTASTNAFVQPVTALPTNISTLEANKLVSVSEQESPNTPCLSIGIHMQLV